jgi:integrase
MATAQTWRRTRTRNVYVRESKTSPTGKLWKAYYPGPRDPATGRQRQQTRTFPREREAVAFLEQVAHRKVTGTLTDSKAGRRPLQELYDEVHAARSYAPATRALHRELWKTLEPLADLAVADIDPPTVDRVVGKIDKPAMREKARVLLSTLFRHAIAAPREWGVVSNPATKPGRKKTRQEKLDEGSVNGKKEAHPTLDDKQLKRLLDALPIRYRALAELMARVGVRPGEAYALRVGKLKAEEGEFDPETETFGSTRWNLKVDTSITNFTKSGEPRTITLPSVVAESLIEHIVCFSDPSDPDALVFPAEQGGMIVPNNFRPRVWAPALEAAGLDHGLSPNQLRHTAAAFAIGHGANIYDIQRMMGHSKPSITLDTYGYLWKGSQDRLAVALDEAIRSS